MSRALRTACVVCGALFLLTSAFVCARVADRGRFTGAYSSYGAGPKGTRALYLLSERMGLATSHWAQDLAGLPAAGGVLVALGACDTGMARPLSRYENQELIAWVEQGGVLLVAGARQYIPAELGVSFARDDGCDAAWKFSARDADEDAEPVEPEQAPASAPDAGAAADAGTGTKATPIASVPLAGESVHFVWTLPVDALLSGIETIMMRDPGRLALDADADARVLLVLPTGVVPPAADIDDASDAGERVAGVVVRRGKGHVIALASASMLENQTMAAADGGVLFARLLREYGGRGPVLFDEYHLGVGERRSLMRYLRQAGALPYMLQLALCALLVLWRRGARFGGVREPIAHAQASSTSFVSALGSLFARAGDAPAALHILAKQALTRIAAYHHMPAIGAEPLARLLLERGCIEAARAVQRIAALAAEDMRSPGRLAVTSRAFDDAVARACQPTA